MDTSSLLFMGHCGYDVEYGLRNIVMLYILSTFGDVLLAVEGWEMLCDLCRVIWWLVALRLPLKVTCDGWCLLRLWLLNHGPSWINI